MQNNSNLNLSSYNNRVLVVFANHNTLLLQKKRDSIVQHSMQKVLPEL